MLPHHHLTMDVVAVESQPDWVFVVVQAARPDSEWTASERAGRSTSFVPPFSQKETRCRSLKLLMNPTEQGTLAALLSSRYC